MRDREIQERSGRASATATQLDLEIRDDACLIVGLSERLSGRFAHEQGAPRDRVVQQFVRARGPDPDDVLAGAQERPDVAQAWILDGRDTGVLLEARTKAPTVATLVLDAGGLLAHARAQAGVGRARVLVPPYGDPDRVVDRLLDELDDVDLRARREGEVCARALSRQTSRGEVLERLTDRQLQVLRAAHGRGYFERPRRRSAEAIADALGISQSTFSQHLREAERKLMDWLLSDEPS